MTNLCHDVFRVVLPVCGDVERAARGEAIRHEIQEPRLHDAALVMPLLRPRIGEVKVDACERRQRDHCLQHLDGIMPDQPEIADARIPGLGEAVTDTGFVNLDTDEIEFRVFRRLLHQRVAVAEPDFQHHGRSASEQRFEVQQVITELHAEFRPPLLQRPLLRSRETSRPAHEAADGSVPCRGVGARTHSRAL